ncbi:MAG TPA: DUF4190 domain-containing protein [Pyrinomonadaceae bacterium]|jgi:hypothetical protein|nr:DUF4190 domain-containing protein [Pyrinomonadaceae bacterium]
MKRCPKCGQSYTDPDINFCLNDGELLSRLTEPSYSSPFGDQRSPRQDDSPPTVVLDQSRVTNPIGWNPPASPPVRYQPPQGQIFSSYTTPASPNPTLGIVSLVAGLCSILGFCCSIGFILSPAAIITGIVALVQNKKDPERYGGRGFAIGGIATGIAFLVFWVIYVLLLIGGSIIQGP